MLQIAEAYKRKIEAIVRKPGGAGRPGGEEEEIEPVSPCPHCGCRSPVSALECTQCLGRIPYCIVTGLRMAAHDWTLCPSCRFPALYTKFVAIITAEKVSCDNEILCLCLEFNHIGDFFVLERYFIEISSFILSIWLLLLI